MKRTLRVSAICALFTLMAVSTFAQNSPLVGTVIDVDEGRNRLQIESDYEAGTRVTVETDAVSTTYHGFGTVIAGKPEIFSGSAGLANVRLGDRVEIRGAARAQGIIAADSVRLLGREVAASQVGVGQTRNPKVSATTPTDDRTAAPAPDAAGRIDGTIRQINLDEGRLVIQTTQRRMITVKTYRNTPVYYRGETYRVSNLEVGDRVRVEPDPRDAQSDEISARTIEVTSSVQDSGSPSPTGAVVTNINGRITRIEQGLDYAYIDDGRGGEIRVDMRQATDANREVIHARDLRVGDDIDISGSYNRVGDMFLASTVRFGALTPARADETRPDYDRPSVVTITGTITETLEDSSTLGFRDRDTNRVARIWVTEGFAVRTKAGTYVRAETLRVNDTAVIDAFRDSSGNLYAQSIRLRNR